MAVVQVVANGRVGLKYVSVSGTPYAVLADDQSMEELRTAPAVDELMTLSRASLFELARRQYNQRIVRSANKSDLTTIVWNEWRDITISYAAEWNGCVSVFPRVPQFPIANAFAFEYAGQPHRQPDLNTGYPTPRTESTEGILASPALEEVR